MPLPWTRVMDRPREPINHQGKKFGEPLTFLVCDLSEVVRSFGFNLVKKIAFKRRSVGFPPGTGKDLS